MPVHLANLATSALALTTICTRTSAADCQAVMRVGRSRRAWSPNIRSRFGGEVSEHPIEVRG